MTEQQQARIWVTGTLAGRIREGDGNPFTHYVYCTVVDPFGDVVWDGWVACSGQDDALKMLKKHPLHAVPSLMERDWLQLVLKRD